MPLDKNTLIERIRETENDYIRNYLRRQLLYNYGLIVD